MLAALGVGLLAVVGLHGGSAVRPTANLDDRRQLLADLEAFEAERSPFRRLLPGEKGVTAESVSAYYEALFSASATWVRRWPRREFAWRARLEALLGLETSAPAAAREAAVRALESLANPDNIVYPEPTELLAARALVRHSIDLNRARELAARALATKLDFLDRLQSARPAESFDARRRRWRWRTALVQVEAAEAEANRHAWEAALAELEQAAAPRPSDASAESLRQAAVEYAACRLELHRRRARFAAAEGRPLEALAEWLRAVELRPAFQSNYEPPANQAALDEAHAAWLAAGRSHQEWNVWLERRKGYPIPR